MASARFGGIPAPADILFFVQRINGYGRSRGMSSPRREHQTRMSADAAEPDIRVSV
jgi:hypothetical protein